MMGRIRLYNTETGKWEMWHVETAQKPRPGRILKRVGNSFRQTWRRLVGNRADRTYYTFKPSELKFVDECKLRQVERLVRRAGRRVRLMELLQVTTDAVMSMVMMQKHLK